MLNTVTTAAACSKPSDIEDLFSVNLYIKYFNTTFASQLAGVVITEADLPPGDRIVQRLEQYLKDKGLTIRPSGGFNHYAVASRFASSPPKSLDVATIARFLCRPSSWKARCVSVYKMPNEICVACSL